MKLVARLGLGLLVLAVVAVMALRATLAASRPQAVGTRAVAGLAAPVAVERDAAGVVTLRGGDRADLAFATGFVHAQERFFQMDLMRRAAAGELAELVGERALDYDRGRRLHRMRAVAERTVAVAHAADVALVEAYAAGVNAGLEALRARPFEYVVLRQAPRPWTPVDTVLVTHAMWFDLTDETGARERERARLAAALPAAVVELLMPRATPWDSPLRPEQPQPPLPELPGPEVVDLRAAPPAAAAVVGDADPERERLLGSNNFAVGGALTADGRAILAGDMHLGHGVPNIWFRVRLVGPGLDATGVTLPGTPLLVAGSNGAVAWAFTNSYGDWTDLRRLELDGDRYRTPEGWAELERHRETIAVAGGDPVELEVRATRWGPVLEDAAGAWAIEWLAHRPEATNLELLHAEQASSVDELVALAPRIGIPPQNMALADAAGRVGWTIAGRIPLRAGWREAADGWLPRGPELAAPAGFREDAAGIAVVDPPAHRIWSANARVASGEALLAIGDGGYDLGARARQIRDGLAARERFAEADLLAIQLDDRALFLAPWRELLLATLARDPAPTAARAEARRLVEGWSGRAAVGDAGYRIVRAFRLEARRRMVAAFEAPLRAADPEFLAFDGGFEGALWRIVTERPAHLLPAGHADWDGFLLGSLDAVLAELGAGGRPLASATWGQANRARIRHPLSGVPGIAALYDMPATPLPGDSNMPRVQARAFGASQRMVVAPGREADGYFHMPAGQSGHPFAPYYGAGHADWEQGRPTPFLPGPTRWTLTLAPAHRDGALALADAAAPAAAGSLAPRLAAAPDGTLLASWLEPRAAGGHALRWARRGADGWSAPRDAAAGADWFVNWADTPGLFQAGDQLVAHWLRKSGDSTYAYDVVLATSDDGGATWSAPRSPHHDGTATEHGFVSHFVTRDGFGLVWLDGRNTSGGGHEGHDGHGGGGGMTLRSARFDARGAQLDEQLVDDLTCDCCPTDVTATHDGPLMVYRDRTAEEVRDVFVARLGAAGWEAPRPVGVDRWHMPGCPVNGPAVDAAAARVAVAWFTAEGERPRVQLAWSRDGGASFGAPQRIDDGAPVGRVELVMRGDHALAIWLEQAGDGAAVLRARRAWPDGTLGAPSTLAGTAAARSSGFPRAVRAGDGVFLAWTDVDASGAKQVRVARLLE